MTWYSSKRDGRSDRDRRFFSENSAYFEELEIYGLMNSAIAGILGIKEYQVWKWSTGQTPIPGKYKKKLGELFSRLGREEISKLTVADHK